MHVPTVIEGSAPRRAIAPGAFRLFLRGALRLLALAIALALLLLTTSLGHLGGAAQAAVRAAADTGAPPAAEGPKRAVIVVGPVGGLTSSYLTRGREVADAAERHGMEVTRIFHPHATWERVVAAANGADLFVYLGHGNGWPSPYGPFQEDTKNGLGLNPTDGETNASRVHYVGADHIRESIRFAPNAIVIIGKACYSAGNGEEWMATPTREVARQRVDNYAAGFLASGAATVFALTWQPAVTIVDALFAGSGTMDAIFRQRWGAGDGPYYGWVGWRPGLVYDSVRTPGARYHLDPDPKAGYRRAVSGDLAMTTDEWLASAAPPSDDTTPPVISDVSTERASDTIVAADDGPAVFTPNGDGLSETLVIHHTLSEPAALDVQVERVSNGNIVRQLTGWSREGRSSTAWDGRKDSGEHVADGRYRIHITPRDRSGNVGEGVVVVAKVLTSLKRPTATPGLFDPTDGDELGSIAFSAPLLRTATITWQVIDAGGAVVRTGLDGVEVSDARTTFTWDGRDDAGAPVPRGRYRARVSATTSQGTYAHTTASVLARPFLLVPGDWTVRRGQTLRLAITAAEPVEGKPLVIVRQPGLPELELRVRRLDATSFVAPYTVQPGGRDGRIRISISSTDTAGGTQSDAWALQLR